MTGRVLLTGALVDINQLAPGEPLEETDASEGLRHMNDWIDSLALEGLTVHYILRTVKALTGGTASYTIGAGGGINIPRPDDIQDDGTEGARLILDNTASPVTEIPLKIFSAQEWQLIAQKDLQSPLAAGIYYDRSLTAGLGRVFLWPVPSVGTTSLVLYTRQVLTEYTSLDIDITYPRGYRLFMRSNLAKQLAGVYGVEVPKRIDEVARDSKGLVKRANLRAVTTRVDNALIGRGEGFNYRTGEIV